MNNIHDIADYLIDKLSYGGKTDLTMLKLQKLLYYAQAWYLVNNNNRLFDGPFQAWVHGPVNRDVFDRFKDTHYLYTVAKPCDKQATYKTENISEEDRRYLDDFLEVYGSSTGTDLERQSHFERPWLEARGNIGPLDACTNEINEEIMREFYSSLLRQAD